MIHLRQKTIIDSDELFNYDNKRDIIMAYLFSRYHYTDRFISPNSDSYYIPVYIPKDDEMDSPYFLEGKFNSQELWYYREILNRLIEAGCTQGTEIFIEMYFMEDINE